MATVIETRKAQKFHEACGSLIEFSLNELKEDFHRDYLGDVEYYRYLICPGCNEEMRFARYGPI